MTDSPCRSGLIVVVVTEGLSSIIGGEGGAVLAVLFTEGLSSMTGGG